VPKNNDKYFFINSLAKGMNILELLSENDTLSVVQAGRLMDINRASSHRFLSTLRELGYVDKDENSKYHLTSKLLMLGMKLLDRFEIRKVAQPFMQELAIMFNETINLGFFSGTEIITIDKIDSTEILRMDSGVGGKEPAHCTSMGKAILSYLPDIELEKYFEKSELKAFTINTLTSKDDIKKEILSIREKGYAIDDEEFSMGLRCVGAPIFSHDSNVCYAMSISGPTTRLKSEKIDKIKTELRKIAECLSEKLGSVRFAEKNYSTK
jgi:DNA-binding IclR family transcriptional regulator